MEEPRSELVKTLEPLYNAMLKARKKDPARLSVLQQEFVDLIEREIERPLFPSDAVAHILVARKPVGVMDHTAKFFWMLFADIIVGETKLPGGIKVITMFNGEDATLDGRGFFTTRVIVARADKTKEHYATWEEAEAGHQKWVAAQAEG